MCEFISQIYTYVTRSSPLSLFLRDLKSTSLDHIEAYADKGNIISSKRKRSFLRNIFVICEFHSQSYSWVLSKQFANSLFVESAKWDLGDHRGPWWKRKYPQIITTEKLSQRLLSDGWLHHTDFHPSLLEQFSNSVILCSAKWYLGAHWDYVEKGNILRWTQENSLLRICIVMCECKS